MNWPLNRQPFKGEEFEFGGQWYAYVQNVGTIAAKTGDAMTRVGGHGQMYDGSAMVASEATFGIPYGTSLGPLSPGNFGWVKKP